MSTKGRRPADEDNKKLEEKNKVRSQEISKEVIKTKEENKYFDKVINCPYCEGTGEVYIRREWKKADSGWGCDMRYSIASSSEYQHHLDNPNDTDENLIWDHDYKEDKCPYCKGEGIAFAWYEKKGARDEQCSKCCGVGTLTKRIKLEIGIEEAKVECDMCNGTGKIMIPEKEIVHIKTTTRLKNRGGQFDGWVENTSSLLDVEINEKNREIYLKAKPRFS